MDFCQLDSKESPISSPAFTNAGSAFVSIFFNSVAQIFFTESLESHQVQAFLEKWEVVSRISDFYREQLDSCIFFYEKILTWASKGEAPVSSWAVFQEIRVFGKGALMTPVPIHIQNPDSWQGCFLCFHVYTVKRNWSLCYSILECWWKLWTKANLGITEVLICVTNLGKVQSS